MRHNNGQNDSQNNRRNNLENNRKNDCQNDSNGGSYRENDRLRQRDRSSGDYSLAIRALPLIRSSSLLATAISLALASTGARAQESTSSSTTKALPKVSVQAAPEQSYQTDRAASPKYTAPLQETPQTITVVTQQVMAQQNLLNLRDTLATLPGITFGAGEGGGGYGDSINLRGYSANNDIQVDGVRDSAQYSRTDSFNVEQIQVTNGASSVYSGSGAVGGTIDLITKRPLADDQTIFGAGVGTDDYGRLTADANHKFGEHIAARLNLMRHENDVPGRDVETFERWGVAPAVTFGLDSPTRLTLLYTHQEDDNIPQYGVPFALGAFNGGQLPGSPPSAYYGYRNIDRQEITRDTGTAIVDHEFNPAISLRSLTRWQDVSQLSIVDPPQGTWCTADAINPWTGAACAAPGTYLPSGPRGTARDANNRLLINQTDFTTHFATGAVRHTLVTGFSISEEKYRLDSGNVLRNPLGATPNPALPAMSISNPDNLYTGPVNLIRTSEVDSTVRNRAIYAFDRLELGRKWEINGGVRFETNEGRATTTAIATPYPAPPAAPVATRSPLAENSDDLLSYRLGLVYKPAANVSLYVAAGNSETPSQSTVNGACTLTSATGTANCNVDPEKAVNYEIGAKWNAFDRLALTAAVFRNERTNFRVASGDPTVPEQQLDGSSRVDGIALGAAGNISDRWSIFANYTFLDSEILQNISDIAVLGGTVDFQKGDPLPNTPKQSLSAWSTYTLPLGLTIGYGVTYQGAYTFNRAAATAGLNYTPSYWVHRAMASYQIGNSLMLQLNVNNLFDKEYFERIRNNATNGWATPGAARSAVLSATYSF